MDESQLAGVRLCVTRIEELDERMCSLVVEQDNLNSREGKHG